MRRVTQPFTIPVNHRQEQLPIGSGEIVWEFTRADAPQYKLANFQEVTRLANGNTLISNWIANAVQPADWPKTVQFIEVTPDKTGPVGQETSRVTITLYWKAPYEKGDEHKYVIDTRIR